MNFTVTIQSELRTVMCFHKSQFLIVLRNAQLCLEKFIFSVNIMHFQQDPTVV